VLINVKQLLVLNREKRFVFRLREVFWT